MHDTLDDDCPCQTEVGDLRIQHDDILSNFRIPISLLLTGT
jgi:hypothetical protein